MDGLRVADCMTRDPITVDPRTTLPIAYQLMRINNVRRLPVVDEDGRLVGIVTMGDVREARPKETEGLSSWELHLKTASLEVREFMTPNPLTVGPEDSLRTAARLMLDHKVGGLPVVEDGRVVGIITVSDILRLLLERLMPTESTAAASP